MADHLHLLVGTKPTMVLSDLVRDIKGNSSCFTLEKGLVRCAFEWQDSFGAFTLGHSQLPKIIPYIQTQEEHHRVHTFREEYMAFLQRYEVDYKPEYLFQEVNQAVSLAVGCCNVYKWRSYGALIPFPTRCL